MIFEFYIMSLSIGIVGLPNVGKSTLFNILTKKQVEASNYPFCTIDPNVGVVKVPDKRLDKIASISQPAQVTPTTIEFVDIAGLVKGANEGEGLGNQFLANIRECDAICEVVRDFKDKNVFHVDNKIDPDGDKETIDTELMLADISTVDKRLAKTHKETKGGDKETLKFKELLENVKENLENGVPVRQMEITKEQKESIKELHLLTVKPMLYVLNIDDSYKGEELPAWSENVIRLNIRLEEEIAGLGEEEQAEYIQELGLDRSGVDKLIRASYDLLELITFFTTGPQESRAWTLEKKSTAPEAAGKVHTDMQKGFVKAEVIYWEEFVQLGGEQAAKDKGAMRLEGKDYIVQDGDICHFLHNK